MNAVLSYNEAAARYERRGLDAEQARIDRDDAIEALIARHAAVAAVCNSPLAVKTRLELVESVWEPEQRDELLALLIEEPASPRTQYLVDTFRRELQARAAAYLSVHPAIVAAAEREYDVGVEL
jgi:hypothetical protein